MSIVQIFTQVVNIFMKIIGVIDLAIQHGIYFDFTKMGFVLPSLVLENISLTDFIGVECLDVENISLSILPSFGEIQVCISVKQVSIDSKLCRRTSSASKEVKERNKNTSNTKKVQSAGFSEDSLKTISKMLQYIYINTRVIVALDDVKICSRSSNSGVQLSASMFQFSVLLAKSGLSVESKFDLLALSGISQDPIISLMHANIGVALKANPIELDSKIALQDICLVSDDIALVEVENFAGAFVDILRPSTSELRSVFTKNFDIFMKNIEAERVVEVVSHTQVKPNLVMPNMQLNSTISSISILNRVNANYVPIIVIDSTKVALASKMEMNMINSNFTLNVKDVISFIHKHSFSTDDILASKECMAKKIQQLVNCFHCIGSPNNWLEISMNSKHSIDDDNSSINSDRVCVQTVNAKVGLINLGIDISGLVPLLCFIANISPKLSSLGSGKKILTGFSRMQITKDSPALSSMQSPRKVRGNIEIGDVNVHITASSNCFNPRDEFLYKSDSYASISPGVITIVLRGIAVNDSSDEGNMRNIQINNVSVDLHSLSEDTLDIVKENDSNLISIDRIVNIQEVFPGEFHGFQVFRESMVEKIPDPNGNPASYWEKCLQENSMYIKSRILTIVDGVHVNISGKKLYRIGKVIGQLQRCFEGPEKLDFLFNPIKVFDSPLNLSCTQTNAVRVNSIDVSIEGDNYEHPQEEFLRPGFISVSSNFTKYQASFLVDTHSSDVKSGFYLRTVSIPGLVSKTTLSVDGDLGVQASDGNQTIDIIKIRGTKSLSSRNFCEDIMEEDVAIFGLSEFVGNSASWNKIPIQSSITCPATMYYNSDHSVAVGYQGNYSLLMIEEINAQLDVITLHHIMVLLGNFSAGMSVGSEITYQRSGCRDMPKVKDSKNNLLVHKDSLSLKHLPSPNSVSAVKINMLTALLTYELKEVVVLGASDYEQNQVKYGPSLSQTSINLIDLQAVDLTAPSAPHRKFINTISADSSSVLELHITSAIGECSVLEARLENAKIFYLQRVTMTLLNFLRDQFFAGMGLSRSLGTLVVKKNIVFVSETVSMPIQENEVALKVDSFYRSFGMFRFGAILRQCEVHLPTSSHSTDALTIITSQTTIYKSDPVIESINGTKYTMTPYISKRMWISEVKNVRIIFSALFSEMGTGDRFGDLNLSDLVWKLPLVNEVMNAPRNLPHGPSIMKLNLDLTDTTICSWCNQNAIGEHINLTGYVTNQPASQELDGMYGEVVNTLGFEIASNAGKGTTVVDISADQVDWILSQGQYQTIVYLIQHNFSEQMCIVPDLFIQPIPKLAPLQEDVYGRYALDPRLPILSTVPIHIARGRIKAVENTSEYYDLVQRPLMAQDWSLPSYMDRKQSNQANRHSRFSWGKTMLFSAVDSVPEYSFSHLHRRKLFSRLPISSLQPRDTTKEEPFDFDPILGKHFITINFVGLELDFYRRHFGGGSGIYVGANCFVIVDDTVLNNKNKFSDDLEDYQPGLVEIADIPTERIVLGPNYLPQFASKMKNVKDIPFTIPNKPHIVYTQQGLNNLRRCIVDISDTVAIARLVPIIIGVAYFVEPVTLGGHRNLSIIESMGLGPFDFKGGLDVEVHAINTVYSLPYTSAKDDTNLVCIYGDLHYTQAARGFSMVGPGKNFKGVDLKVNSIFIAPIQEIRARDSQTFMEPCTISFQMEVMVRCLENKLESHLEKLNPFMELGPWVHKPNKTSEPIGFRRMIITITPEHPQAITKSFPWSVSDRDMVIPNTGIHFNVSTKDITFLIVTIQQLVQTIENKSEYSRKPLKDVFPVMWGNYKDIMHLPKLIDNQVYVDMTEAMTECDNEIIFNCDHIVASLRNNTYNLKILKAQLTEIQISFHKTRDQLHGAAAVTLSAFTFSEEADCWEPLIESVTISAIAGTDVSTAMMQESGYNGDDVITEENENEMENQSEILESEETSSRAETMDSSKFASKDKNIIMMAPKVRVEVNSLPVDINASLNTIVTLMKRITLADVVTTSSVHLPPYLIVNELGIPVDCVVVKGQRKITREIIKVGSQLPIEIQQLSTASKQKQSSKTLDSDESEEHSLSIAFFMFGQKFESKKSVAIDREGITSVEIKYSSKSSHDKIEGAKDDQRRKDSLRPDYYGAPETQDAIKSLQKSIKSGGDIPYIVMSMRMKDDGGRELILRSILTLKNSTNRVLQIAVQRDKFLNSEISLAPGKEWCVPLYLAHPNASIFLRFDDKSEWFKAMPLITSLLTQGYWGSPTKMRAEIVACPADSNSSSRGSKYPWVLLIKPEVKTRLGGNIGAKVFVPVKYPSKEAFKPSIVASLERGDPVDGMVIFDEIYNLGFSPTTSFNQKVVTAQPMTIHLMAPLQVCSLVSQPLLYRIANFDGLITSEGVLLPGEIVDVHSLSYLFSQKIYISIRLINYGWSKWTKIFTRTNPFPASERLVDVTMQSLALEHNDSSMTLPTLDVSMSIREHMIRLSCPVCISNNTGLALEYCDSGFMDQIVPHDSLASVESFIKFPSLKNISDEKRVTQKQDEGSDNDDIGRGCDEVGSDNEDLNQSVEFVSRGNDNYEHDNFSATSGFNPSSQLSRIVSLKKSNKFVTLIIHLPQDHLRTIEIPASIDWTLREVFQRIMSRISINPIYQKESNYSFTLFEQGSKGYQSCEFSPAVEQSMFSRKKRSGNGDKQDDDNNGFDFDDDDDEEPADDDEPMNEDGKASSNANGTKAPAKLEKKTSYFTRSAAPAAAPKKEYVRDQTAFDADFPPNLKLGMIVDLNSLQDILYMSSTVESLQGHRLRLCYTSELHIYRQILLTRTIAPQKESSGFISSIFNRSKNTFRTPFMIWELKEIPFHPHRVIGFSSQLCIRSSNKTSWCDPVNLDQVGIGGSGVFMLLETNKNSDDDTQSVSPTSGPNEYYELGLFLERGKGFFQSINSFSIVPKHIIISKLSFPIDIRQWNSEKFLPIYPGKVTIFHHYFKNLPKLVQFRRHFATLTDLNLALNNENKSTSMQTVDDNRSELWCGEVDISGIGVVYGKLVNPVTIIKIQIEVVGGSLVATFSEQNYRWPPYKLYNHSSLNVRFKQVLKAPVSFAQQFSSNTSKSSTNTATKDTETTATSVRTDTSASMDPYTPQPGHQPINFEVIAPGSAVSYTWDLPHSGSKQVYLEFLQGASWERKEINLDDIGKTTVVKLMKTLPSLHNPLAEGALLRREGFSTSEFFQPVYCILKGFILFIFRDDSRSDLLDMIHLSRFLKSTNVNKFTKNLNSSGNGNDTFIQMCRVIKYDKGFNDVSLTSRFFSRINSNVTSQEFFGGLFYCNSSSGYISSFKDFMIDINQARIFLLRVAELLALFDDKCIKISNEERFSNESESADEAEENEDVATNDENKASESTSGAATSEQSNSTNETNCYTLVEMLEKGFCVDQLLDMIVQRPIYARDFVRALVLLSEAEDESTSMIAYEILLEKGIISQTNKPVMTKSNSKLFANEPENSNTPSSTTKKDFFNGGMSEDALTLAEDVNDDDTFDETDRKSMHARKAVQARPTSVRGSVLGNNKFASGRFDVFNSTTLTLESLGETKIFLNPPVINPELMDTTFDVSQMSDTPTQSATAEKTGLIITMGTEKYSFLCTSNMEYLGWLQACRQSIELTWVDFMLGKPCPQSEITLESFKMKVSLRIRSDGPTKVLEIMEGEVKSDSIMNALAQKRIGEEDDDDKDDFELRHSLLSWKKSYRITDALSASISVTSLALSFIDNEPSEFLYLCLQDIEMSIERTRRRVQMSATIQTIQVSNQVVKPSFPVTFFPRRKNVKNGQFIKLMLPGLHQKNESYPTLHLFFQEKYHSKSEIQSFKEDQESNLVYFDMFSLWLAPMQLDLDEEVFVRLVRYIQALRLGLSRMKSNSQDNVLEDDMLEILHQGNKSWGTMDTAVVSKQFQSFINATINHYERFDIYAKPSRGLYFSLLQLHPVDIILHLRPTPDFPITTTEYTMVSLLSQLDSAQLRLNAFFTEHAYGSTALFFDILLKHYRAAIWRQIQSWIGSSEIVEGSVGLVSNLGTGVYDLFYEPIDGLMGENSSFLNGLSKGGKSLATRTIGGTSALTSKITGGLGRGVSMLTLDSDFQRNRASRRLNKTSSVSEGLYVGTRELGKNIVEGVTGIVVSPYRGWESGGSVGFGVGIAKGILGVALKPAVGVFDLASRATEGIRNSALSTANKESDLQRIGIFRTRFPRTFGRHQELVVYNPELAAAQHIVDILTGFPREQRYMAISHQHIIRKVVPLRFKKFPIQNEDHGNNHVHHSHNHHNQHGGSNHHDVQEPLKNEAWGMKNDESYIVALSVEKIVLISVKSCRGSVKFDASFVWSCPVTCIDSVFHDRKGDLILNINLPIAVTGTVNNSSPVLLNEIAVNYHNFQKLLEPMVGVIKAREQSLSPKGGLIDTDVLKRYATGIRSLITSPTKHTYQIVGCVLYEYTIPVKKGSKDKDKDKDKEKDKESSNTSDGASPINEADKEASTPNTPSNKLTIEVDDRTSYVLNNLFGKNPKPMNQQRRMSMGSTNTVDDLNDSIEPCPEGFLSCMYPLADVVIVGPYPEDHGKHSISISRKESNQKIRFLKRDDGNSLFVEQSRTVLQLVFSSKERATSWIHFLEKHCVHRTSNQSSHGKDHSKAEARSGVVGEIDTPQKAALFDNSSNMSIDDLLAIPMSGTDGSEKLKIEIAKLMTVSQR